jgi:glycosyltransferase involved in cell wall biosynthesis
VAFFAAYPHVYGGTERGLQLLATGLGGRGWDVDILLPADGLVADRFRAADLNVELVEAPPALLVYGGETRGGRALRAAAALPAYWSRVRRRVRGADIVHAFTQRAVTLAGPAARLAGVPLVWHVGGTEPSRALNHVGAWLASAAITVSPSAADALPRRARPVIVHNAADPAAFDAPSTSAHGIDVVCAARLTPEKGVDVLVRAAALLKNDMTDLRVLVLGGTQAGHENYRAHLEDLARQLGVADVVCFAGFVEQPFQQWGGARVYVQPSRTEGLPLAVAEAMASALPVVATAVGGVPDLLDEGRAGRLVRPAMPRPSPFP